MNNLSDTLRQSAKGASIKKAGYLSGIHSLPAEVKQKLDQLLKAKNPPATVLRHLSQDFPDIQLPSRSAVYNYKKRYFLSSETSSKVNKKIQDLDIDKVALKDTLVTQLKRFIAVDLPTLRDKWYQSQEKDKQTGQDSKITREMVKLYMDAVKVSLDAIPKLNISLEEAKQESASEKNEAHKEDLSAKLARIIAKRGNIYAIQHNLTPDS